MPVSKKITSFQSAVMFLNKARFAAVCCFLFCLVQAPAQNLKTLLKQGEEAMAEKDYFSAAQIYNKVIYLVVHTLNNQVIYIYNKQIISLINQQVDYINNNRTQVLPNQMHLNSKVN